MKCIAVTVVLLALAIVLVGLPVSAQLKPMYIPCGGSNVTFQGHVYDTANNALQYVAVNLRTPPRYEQYEGTAVSDSSGHWSLVLPDCPYNGYFYWKSEINGPLVKSVSNIPYISSYALSIERQTLKVPVTYEFPNSPNTEIAYSTATSVMVSIDASFDVGFSTGFLGTNFVGQVGTDITIDTGYSSSGYAPWRDFLPTGTAYRITDTSGRHMVWVDQWHSAQFSSESTTEKIGMETAETRMVQNSTYPFVWIAALHNATYTKTLTTKVTIDVEFSVEAFGVKLKVHMGVATGQSQSVSTTIRNFDNQNKCYVLYANGLENHVWYHNSGACPY